MELAAARYLQTKVCFSARELSDTLVSVSVLVHSLSLLTCIFFIAESTQRPFALQHLVTACQGINPDQKAAQPEGAMAEGADMVGAHKYFACVLSCGLQSSYDAIVELFDTDTEESLSEWYVQNCVIGKGLEQIEMQRDLISAGRIRASHLRPQLFFWL